RRPRVTFAHTSAHGSCVRSHRAGSSHSFTPAHVFFFTAPPTSGIYTLSLHDALPISPVPSRLPRRVRRGACRRRPRSPAHLQASDRKSTRLNSSHGSISYAVFCLKKKTRSHDTRYTQPNT